VDDLSRLYRETILRHAQDPVGYGKNMRVTHHCEQFNPLCGDRILLMLEIDGEVIKDAAFKGESCAICKASASLRPARLSDQYGNIINGWGKPCTGMKAHPAMSCCDPCWACAAIPAASAAPFYHGKHWQEQYISNAPVNSRYNLPIARQTGLSIGKPPCHLLK
jgi:hypothetical protein